MDDLLDRRLQAIQDTAETAAVNAGGEVDLLPIRNELEDVEDRLAGFIRENSESLATRIESVSEVVQRLQERLDEIVGMVETIQSEMPAD